MQAAREDSKRTDLLYLGLEIQECGRLWHFVIFCKPVASSSEERPLITQVLTLSIVSFKPQLKFYLQLRPENLFLMA